MFGVREGLLIKDAPSEKMGVLEISQIHLAYWTRLRALNGATSMQRDADGASFNWRTLEIDHL